jgi:hypothetical protein
MLESRSLLISLLGAIFIFAFVLHRAWIWYRLSHVPGPFWGSFSKYWLLRNSVQGNMYLQLREACDRHGTLLETLFPILSCFSRAETFLGSLVRVGPNEVVTNDYEVIRRINAPRTPYVRSDWYLALRMDPPRDNVATMRIESMHHARRAILAAGVSYRFLHIRLNSRLRLTKRAMQSMQGEKIHIWKRASTTVSWTS